MRTFEVRVKVTGCNTCPYSTPDEYCIKSRKEESESLEGMKLHMQNRYQITESCPMHWLSRDKHD